MQTRRKNKAFTIVEVLAIVVVIVILVVLFLPHRRFSNGPRIRCVNNLKQVGMAFRLWSSDNAKLYPMESFTNQTGGLLFADATNGFRYFQVMSNEICTPRILVCPADKRTPAANFSSDFSGAHVSYFVGLDADENRPNTFLAGDRNITNGRARVDGVLSLQNNQSIGWTSELHNAMGNVGFADGSVQELTTSGLRVCVSNIGFATNRLLMP